MTQKQKIISLILFAIVAGGIYLLAMFFEDSRSSIGGESVTTPVQMKNTLRRKGTTAPSGVDHVPQQTPSTPDDIVDAIESDAKNDPALSDEIQGAQDVLKSDAASTNNLDNTYDNQEL